GTAWLDRFRVTGRIADLDHAITAHRRAIAITVAEKENQAGHLANYGDALLARFEQQGDIQDLDAALSADRTAVGLARAARENLASLASWSQERYRAAAVSRAVEVSQSNLSAALLASFEYRRNRADLDDAIGAARAAVALAPEGAPVRAGLLANLAQAVLERFKHFWQTADLEEAAAIAQAASRAAPPRHPARLVSLVALGLAHRARFSYSADLR